jgi:hypothetical protein
MKLSHVLLLLTILFAAITAMEKKKHNCKDYKLILAHHKKHHNKSFLNDQNDDEISFVQKQEIDDADDGAEPIDEAPSQMDGVTDEQAEVEGMNSEQMEGDNIETMEGEGNVDSVAEEESMVPDGAIGDNGSDEVNSDEDYTSFIERKINQLNNKEKDLLSEEARLERESKKLIQETKALL